MLALTVLTLHVALPLPISRKPLQQPPQRHLRPLLPVQERLAEGLTRAFPGFGLLGEEEGLASVETDEPTRTVLELSRRFSGEVPELTIKRPTLEDIYLELVQEG